jgi:predicted RNase H-like HicB family nuclease
MIIKAEIWKEENTWCASVPALKGCHTCADTEEELKQNLQEAIQLWLEAMNSISSTNKLIEINV